jgi:hypothetical protein
MINSSRYGFVLSIPKNTRPKLSLCSASFRSASVPASSCRRDVLGPLSQRSFLMSVGLRLFEQQRLDVAKDHRGIEGLVRIDLADKALLVDQKHF